jgi:hypothetical protein
MQNSNGALRSINSSRMTVDPEGTLWFSNVTREDTSDDFVYACSATSLFRYVRPPSTKLNIIRGPVLQQQKQSSNKKGNIDGKPPHLRYRGQSI